MQTGDIAIAIAELVQNGVSVVTGIWARRNQLARRPAEGDRLTHQFDRAENRVLHRLRDTEMLYLWVGKHLVDRIDRAARHPGSVKALDPLAAVVLARD